MKVGDRVRYQSDNQGWLTGTITRRNEHGRWFVLADRDQPGWTGSIRWNGTEFSCRDDHKLALIEPAFKIGDKVTFERDPFLPGRRRSGTIMRFEGDDLVYIRDDNGTNWQRSVSGKYGEIKLIERETPVQQASTHDALDLINAVAILPPSNSRVVKQFAEAVLGKADDSGMIGGDDVAAIVNGWPGACDNGRSDFLSNNNVVVASKVSVTLTYDDGSIAIWNVDEKTGRELHQQLGRPDSVQ